MMASWQSRPHDAMRHILNAFKRTFPTHSPETGAQTGADAGTGASVGAGTGGVASLLGALSTDTPALPLSAVRAILLSSDDVRLTALLDSAIVPALQACGACDGDGPPGTVLKYAQVKLTSRQH